MIFKDLNTRTADVVIAASNSSEKMKKSADYVCTGSDDQELINEALASIASIKTGYHESNVLLCSGNYNISNSIVIHNGVAFRGASRFTTIISSKDADIVGIPAINLSKDYEVSGNIYAGAVVIEELTLDNYSNIANNDWSIAIEGADLYSNMGLIIRNIYSLAFPSGVRIKKSNFHSYIQNFGLYSDSGATHTKSIGIELIDVDNTMITNNYIRYMPTGIKLDNNCDRVIISNNVLRDCNTSIDRGTSTSLIIKNNQGASNSGTATVPNGATSVDVTHNVKRTPGINEIIVTPTNNLGNASKYWISNVQSTTFRINVDADPGSSTATFTWQIP